MITALGWLAALCAMSIPIPQLLRPGRVSHATYYLAVATHCGYGSLGLIHGHYWMTAASSWGLVMSGLVIYRATKHRERG